MKILKKTCLFILRFFYFPGKMFTESLSKSVSLKLTVSISLLTEKNKQTHKHCIHLFIHEMYHKLALGLTHTAHTCYIMQHDWQSSA